MFTRPRSQGSMYLREEVTINHRTVPYFRRTSQKYLPSNILHFEDIYRYIDQVLLRLRKPVSHKTFWRKNVLE